MANTPSLPSFSGVLVPNTLGPLCTVGSLAQEQAAYTALGWAYTAAQIPNGPPNAIETYASQLGPGQDVHGDFEADDLWQNLVMYRRTGNILYRQMAELWANYYINHYENDLASGGNPDSSFGYDHLFGYGLIDWFEETWDFRALAAAVRLGNISLVNYHSTPSLRTDARHLLLAIRLWEKTGEQKWRDHAQIIRDDLFNPAKWPIASGQPNSYDPVKGIWMIDRGAAGEHVTVNSVHHPWINLALARYYEATGGSDVVVHDQLIKMAQFAQTYGLNQSDGQSGAYIAFDTGSPVHFGGSNHTYTTYWVDTLARGFILTGTAALRDLAITFWKNGTDAPANQVGRFINKNFLSSSPFYLGNGELSYAGTLFSLTLSPPPPPPPPGGIVLADNTWKTMLPATSQRYIPRSATPTDTLESSAEPVGRSYTGCFLYPPGKIFYFGGAHGSYPGNDVEIYDLALNIWSQSYKPEVCALNDTTCNGIYQWGRTHAKTPLGRPHTTHLYQQAAWDPVAQKFMVVAGQRTWSYEPVNKVWTELKDGYPGSGGGDINTEQLFAYDTDLQSVLLAQTATGDRGLYKWNGTDWVLVTGFPADINASWLALYNTYMPDLHAHIVKGYQQTWKFHTPTLTWTPIAALPANTKDFEYDTKNHVVIALTRDTTSATPVGVWVYNPATDIWTQQTVATPAPAQNVWSGGFQLLRYDPTNNIFIYLATTAGGGYTGGTVQTWAYRYKN